MINTKDCVLAVPEPYFLDTSFGADSGKASYMPVYTNLQFLSKLIEK